MVYFLYCFYVKFDLKNVGYVFLCCLGRIGAKTMQNSEGWGPLQRCTTTLALDLWQNLWSLIKQDGRKGRVTALVCILSRERGVELFKLIFFATTNLLKCELVNFCTILIYVFTLDTLKPLYRVKTVSTSSSSLTPQNKRSRLLWLENNHRTPTPIALHLCDHDCLFPLKGLAYST